MTHVILDSNGTALTAICGEKMPRSKPNGHEFHYRFGEADVREREIPQGLDCPICLAVTKRVKQGFILSAAIREAHNDRRRIA